MNYRERFEQLKAKRTFDDDKELLAFFDELPPVDIEEILSPWKGGDFDTGHWGTPALAKMKWFGKWYKSPLEALPLVCYDDNGNLFSDKSFKGEASLWNISFRGKTSATMVYDGVPIFDHLRKVDDDTLLGVMNGKHVDGIPDIVQDGLYYFFYLERIQELPVKFVE